MDAVTKSAATLVEEDDDNEFRIVSEIRALSGVIDVSLLLFVLDPQRKKKKKRRSKMSAWGLD